MAFVRKRPALALATVRLLDEVAPLGSDAKLELIQRQPFYHICQSAHYLRVLEPGHCQRFVWAICREHNIPLPPHHLNRQLPHVVSRMISGVTRGRLAIDHAARICRLFPDPDKNRRLVARMLTTRVEGARAIRYALSADWEEFAAETAPPKIKLSCQLGDPYHTLPSSFTRLTTSDAVASLTSSLLPDTRITLVYRYSNIPLYAPDSPSLVALKLSGASTVYCVFLFGDDAPPRPSLSALFRAMHDLQIKVFSRKVADIVFRACRVSRPSHVTAVNTIK